MSEGERRWLAWGIFLGIVAFRETVDAIADAAQKKVNAEVIREVFTARNSTTSEVVREISVVYQDPLNLSLPVPELYILAIGLLSGRTTMETMQKELITLRKSYN